jgi:hypothetical protein
LNPSNKHMARKEEPTKAPTPDKLDRSPRDKKNKTPEGEIKPYPLTEEEATPNTPRSEQSTSTEKDHTSGKVAVDTKKKRMDDDDDVARDYNRLVSHPRKR